MLHDSILLEKDIAEAFPEEYEEIASQIAQIKTQMQIHEQMLREETTRKNDLILYLAHDLKTPLASVIGYLNLLRDERNISEDLQERYLSISLSKAERLEDLINEFFDIARFNLTDISLQYGKINLTRLLAVSYTHLYFSPTSWNFIITSGHFPAGKPLFEEIDDTSSSTFWKFIITPSGFAAGKPLFEEIDDTSSSTFCNFIITSSHFVSGKTLFEKKMIRHIPFLGSLSSLQTRCSLYPICSASPCCSREAFATG